MHGYGTRTASWFGELKTILSRVLEQNGSPVQPAPPTGMGGMILVPRSVTPDALASGRRPPCKAQIESLRIEVNSHDRYLWVTRTFQMWIRL
jgi:hypothetical protein